MPPTSASRVTGFGTSMKFLQYYNTDGGQSRRQRKKPTKDDAEVIELRKKVAIWSMRKWTPAR